MIQALTYTAARVAEEFVKNPNKELYGLEIYRAIGSTPGTVYPILHRMQNQGWIRQCRSETLEDSRKRAVPHSTPRHYWKAVPGKLPEMRDYLQRWSNKQRGR